MAKQKQLSDKNKRSERIDVTVTASEKNKLTKEAKLNSSTLSTWAREVLLKEVRR
jgi:hypothetical protein